MRGGDGMSLQGGLTRLDLYQTRASYLAVMIIKEEPLREVKATDDRAITRTCTLRLESRQTRQVAALIPSTSAHGKKGAVYMQRLPGTARLFSPAVRGLANSRWMYRTKAVQRMLCVMGEIGSTLR